MKNSEIIDRNITLTFDFLRQIVKNPSILNTIPNGKVIEFLQKDVPIIEIQKNKKSTKYFKVKHHFEIL
jgi:hypothetical protein